MPSTTCKLIEGTELAEYYVQTQRCEAPKNRGITEQIKERSRQLARPRRDIGTFVAERFAAALSRDGARPESVLYEA